MATTAEEVHVKLTAHMADYERKLEGAARVTDQVFSRVGKASSGAEVAIKRDAAGISGTIKGLAATLAAGFTGRELMGLSDSFTRIQNSLRVAGLEGQNLASVQGQLLDLSSKYGVSLESLASLFGNATQAGQDLGASQQQIVKLTEATSQALLITGTSATQAAGAILGLQQALANGKLQAEEFNQINEGGLRPLLQAAANSEKFGGSVGKLRAAVMDGKITSQDFFAAIIAGSSALEGQASKATLTLSSAFEALNSRLVVYVGEASKTNGASVALATGIKLLADNLDKVIPAIAVISTAIGVGFATNAVAATLKTRTLGAAMLGAFGGPIGLAITAVIAGLGYLTEKAVGARARLEELANGTSVAADMLARAEDRAKKAGVNIDAVATASRSAETPITLMGKALKFASDQAAELAGNAKLAAAATANLERTKAKIEVRDLQATVDNTSAIEGRAARFGNTLPQAFQDYAELNRAALAKRKQDIADLDRTIKLIDATPDKAFDEPKPRTGGGTVDPKKKTKKTAGKSIADIAREQDQELSRLLVEEMNARLQITTNIQDRADLQRQILDEERAQRAAAINANKELTGAQKKARLDALDKLYGSNTKDPNGDIVVVAPGAYRKGINSEERQRQFDADAEILSAQHDANISALRDIEDFAVSSKDRREVAEAILAAETAYKEQVLQSIIDNDTIAKERRDAAQIELDALRAGKPAAEERTKRDTESPMERYRREVGDVGRKINDEMEDVQVDGLKSLNNELTDAIMGAKSLGDAFSNVADQIISDLIRIAVQQAIIKPLADALGLGGGGSGGGGSGGFFGGLLGGVGKVLGFESGGYTGSGARDEVAGVVHKGEYVVPANAVERIGVERLNALSSGAMSAAASMTSVSAASRSGPTTIQQHFHVNAQGAVLASDLMAEMNNVGQQAAVQGAQGGHALAMQDMRRMGRPRL